MSVNPTVCARCQRPDIAITVRNERLCQDCFLRYVETKVTKRLESNKLRASFKEAPKLLLLPFSFGVSSTALLHVLDQQLNYQKARTGRLSFQIHLLFVDQSAVSEQVDFEASWRLLKERFPSHTFSDVSLEDLLDYDSSFELDRLPLQVSATGDVLPTKRNRLEELLAGLPSSTSRADMAAILRFRLISAFARANKCGSIIYGDSTTNLAQRTLSETAKGRGGAIPWLTADGQSPHGVNIVYPMRDLLRKEIEAYTRMTTPPLTPLTIEHRLRDVALTSSKHATIEELMGQYFDSVEQHYPSIVANVVRTSSRLVTPSSEAEALRLCQVCRIPLMEDSNGLHWSGQQAGSADPENAINTEGKATMCYGCTRSMLHS